MIKPKKWIVGLTLIAAFSCKKTTVEEPTTAFTNITANSSFGWSVTKTVTVNITGLATTVPTTATVSIKAKNATENVYVGLHSMSDNIATRIEVPTALDSIQLQCGSIKKMYAVKGVTTISMNYLPTIEADPE